ncbi:integrase core domain-containing protein [Streptomyces sp. NPDC093252]|uniref:integrase core domain-containing protein n=1 Tax=Streptomyces sp. NPDC093252 TaxID=3154980 RepID=UPI00341202AC
MDNKLATTGERRNCKPVIGCSLVHSAVDDHSRPTHSEVLPDERRHTTAGFWQRANASFAAHGITVQQVLTDNGSCYKARLVTRTPATACITHNKIRPYRPQTNGKPERFNRFLLDEWAYQRPSTSNDERTEALADFLHTYNHHRSHTTLGGHPPISRVNNPASQYT